MDHDRWRRLEALSHAARARSASERSAFVAEACGGDEDLRRDLEALLDGPVSAGMFLDRAVALPLADQSSAVPAAVWAGRQLGSYKLGALVGSGGMGEVYRGRDTRLDRDVAIKVLHPSSVADPDLRARLMREARAVAALNHPHIVTIHEVGEADGAPYIAFELVEGTTLRDRLADGALPLHEALALATQIADGLTHAHEAGIVHRDLSPQNVMITREGNAKILDFGLGKVVPAGNAARPATVTTAYTAPGAVIGTPGYMSPEQAIGSVVDARSDQFVFGAMLYEMLTGRRAFQKETGLETLSAIVECNYPPLTKVAPGLPPAVVRIVERCLAKSPVSRYAATRDLMFELRVAHQDLRGISVVQVFRTRSGRVAALSGAVALAIALAVVAVRTPRVADPAATAATTEARQIVVLPFTNIVGDASGQVFSDGMVELLTSKLTQLEQFHQSLRVVPATDVRRSSVASAREARGTFGATIVVSGSVLRSGDRVRLTINVIDAITLRQLNARVIDGDTGDLLALQDAVVSALAALFNLELEPGARAVLAAGSTTAPGAYDFYIQGRGYLQRFERVENVDHAIELFTRALAQDDRFALAHAALGEAYWRKYELTKDRRLVASAREQCRRAIEIDQATPQVHLTLGLIARGTGEYETAVAELTRALALDPVSPDVHRELGRAYEALGRMDAAEATYRKAIEMRPADWSGYGALGRFYAARGRYEEALAQFQRVIELTPDNADAYSNLGGIQVFLKRHNEAATNFERSVAIRPTAPAYSNLGTLYFRQDRFVDAARAFERALQINDSDYRVWMNLAAAYDQVADKTPARAAYEKAAVLAEQERNVNPRRAVVLADLAGLYAVLGQAPRARELAGQAMALAPADGLVLFKLALAHETLGDRARAIQWIAKALKAGYPREQVDTSRALAPLRADPQFKRLVMQ